MCQFQFTLNNNSVRSFLKKFRKFISDPEIILDMISFYRISDDHDENKPFQTEHLEALPHQIMRTVTEGDWAYFMENIKDIVIVSFCGSYHEIYFSGSFNILDLSSIGFYSTTDFRQKVLPKFKEIFGIE